MGEMVQHHVKYKEIHGEDKIVMMEKSEHIKLHKRLRREGKCNIPACELRKIANKAHDRTPTRKLKNAEHKKTQKYKQYMAAYNAEYRNKIEKLFFNEKVAPGLYLTEEITYNNHTGSVYISSRFTGNKLEIWI